MAVAACVAVVLCAYPLWFQFSGPHSYVGMPQFATWGEDPLAWLTFARDTVGGGDEAVERTLGITEQNGWFGWPLVVLTPVLAALLFWRTAAAKVTCVVGATFGVLSLGPVLRFAGTETRHPGSLFFVTPMTPLLNLMTPGRLAYVVIGALAVLLALAWDQLGVPSPVVWRMAVVAVLLPLLPTPLPAEAEPPPPPRFITTGTWEAYVPEGSTMVPVPLPSGWTGRDSLSWSAWAGHEFPVPEGYFLGPSTDGTGFMGPPVRTRLTDLVYRTIDEGAPPPLTPEDIADVNAEIRGWNGSVVVTRVEYETMRALLDGLLGPGRRVLDVWAWDVPPAT